MSIYISGLSKNYGHQTVLNNISLNIREGEIVGFLGPNGAGKTTTMKILTGALPYFNGSVKICGAEIKDNPLFASGVTGYLPEQNPLYPDMYVKEYLGFVADMYRLGKNKKQRVDDVIEMVGLQPEFRKKIGQLSKGYRQRVGLAQALIPDPKVLILDEPTTGLDPNQIEEIRALIRETGKDRTVLFSTHILQEIKAICNRVIIINKGKIVADYPDISTISAFDANHRRFEFEFINDVNETELLKLKDILKVSCSGKGKYNIVASTDIREEIFDYATKSGNKILTMKTLEKSMEEVFRELTVS